MIIKKSFAAVSILLFLSGCSSMNSASEMGMGGLLKEDMTTFSESVKGLPESVPSQTVTLKDGDTYEMKMGYVKHKIGNAEVRMLAYNGSVPGPFFHVQQGSTVNIKVTNNSDILTTLHAHGVRMENLFDGVPYVTQAPIQSGDSFVYKLKFPDPGVYWYHSHFREDYSQDMGLYGNFYSEPSTPQYFSPVDQEEFVIVDDILMDKDKMVPYYKNFTTHAFMGRYGNTFLVNGRTDYSLDLKKGAVVRFFFTNVASARPFDLDIPGVQLKLVGADNGKLEKETWIENGLIIAPGERRIVDAYFPNAGDFQLVHKTIYRTEVLGSITVEDMMSDNAYGDIFNTLQEYPDVKAELEPYKAYLTKMPDKHLLIGINILGLEAMPDGKNIMHPGEDPRFYKIEWEDTMGNVNALSTNKNVTWELQDLATGKINNDIDWTFNRGDKVKVRIFNDPGTRHPMNHAIHFHGQRFLVLATNGVPNTDLSWRDTTLVETGDIVDLLVDMENPGTWMAHCHNNEHLESGLAFFFKVL